MNNEYKRPSSQANASTPEPLSQYQDTSQSVPIVSPQPSNVGKNLIKVFSLLALLALVGGGVYYWQQQRINSLAASQGSMETQVSSLKTRLDAKDKASTLSTGAGTKTNQPATGNLNLITGSVYNNTPDVSAVTAYYIPDTVTEVWVEYGTKPDSLTQSTPHVTGTGEGSVDNYVDQGFNLADLQDGTRYFYRAAGTINGQTVYGGTVGFQAGK
jgi:hypothetical protein